jgi:hypothetical protein
MHVVRYAAAVLQVVALEDPWGHTWVLAQKHGKDTKGSEMQAKRKEWYMNWPEYKDGIDLTPAS